MADSLSLISSSALPAFPKSTLVSGPTASLKWLPPPLRSSPSRLFLHKSRSAIYVSNSKKFRYVVSSPKCLASDPAQLKNAREDIKELLNTKFCHPILVRLGWHDAGTYDKNIEEWPQRGGANGSLRFEVELKHGANAGLLNALNLINPIKEKYPGTTYADLFQLASATAIEEAGGPKIPMKYGRVDVSSHEECPPEGRLPDAGPPSPAEHLRQIFYRMGLSDKDIVALSGAHTLGRSRPERSGWGKPELRIGDRAMSTFSSGARESGRQELAGIREAPLVSSFHEEAVPYRSDGRTRFAGFVEVAFLGRSECGE